LRIQARNQQAGIGRRTAAKRALVGIGHWAGPILVTC
jgi:hypothetical protein